MGQGVWSETGRLDVCLGCSPGPEFDRLLPRHIEASARGPDGALRDSPDYLLFDDLVLGDVLAREHRVLFDVVRAAAREVHDLRDLLADVLADPATRAAVIAEVADLEGRRGAAPTADAIAWLNDSAPRRAVAGLLSGATPDGAPLLRWPMPNWLFARDCLAVVGDVAVWMRPRHPARWRDGALSRAVAAHHPLLAHLTPLDVAAEAAARGLDGEACIEGGDVLVLSERLVLVGVGRRTTWAGAQALALALAERSGPEVLAVTLPDKRAAMHLDTVFTLLDDGLAVGFGPALDPASPPDVRLVACDPLMRAEEPGGLLAALSRRGHTLEVLPCGDGDPVAAVREQWTDGANAVCLAPGRVVLYGRNRRTLAALNRCGFEVVTPEAFIRNAPLLLQGERRLVVAVEGFELSRGRGGPRCLTLPLARAA